MELVFAGILLGIAFGSAARLGNLCFLRGIRQIFERQHSYSAVQIFMLAQVVAIVSTQYLVLDEQIDLSGSLFTRNEFSLSGMVIGGLLFGIGMFLARSCGARALILTGGGNLRALVVLVALGISAQATLTGVLVPLRLMLQQLHKTHLNYPTVSGFLASVDQPSDMTAFALLGVFGVFTVMLMLRNRILVTRTTETISACCVGLLVAAGWWLSSHIGVDEFNPMPPSSLSFIGPVAESFHYLQVAVGKTFNFGPSIVLGTLLGSLLVAVTTKTFLLEGFENPKQFLRYITGGVLMGFGGVLAVGCSVGHGLTGLSSLAWSSLIAVAAIASGAYLGFVVEAALNKDKM